MVGAAVAQPFLFLLRFRDHRLTGACLIHCNVQPTLYAKHFFSRRKCHDSIQIGAPRSDAYYSLALPKAPARSRFSFAIRSRARI